MRYYISVHLRLNTDLRLNNNYQIPNLRQGLRRFSGLKLILRCSVTSIFLLLVWLNLRFCQRLNSVIDGETALSTEVNSGRVLLRFEILEAFSEFV